MLSRGQQAVAIFHLSGGKSRCCGLAIRQAKLDNVSLNCLVVDECVPMVLLHLHFSGVINVPIDISAHA